MSFIDEAQIKVKSGDGGPGMKHFRKEKYVPRGGPDGGDGGRGGNIILVANSHLNTLSRFAREREFEADNGGPGGINNRTGRSADDLRINVPVGTIIRDAATSELVADLTEADQEIIVAKGGRGGRGNARFVSSTNQGTEMVERGEPGEERELALELKLIADVGIVGVPNAGKSTLLSVISNAKPKIAPYPFTTLEPNLGVVRFNDRDLVVADIPGLVEGAHMGIGLGHAFLRHVQRTRILIHLLDGGGENPLADFTQINSELALFDEELAQKPQIIVYNKMDLPDAQERWPQVQAELEKRGYSLMNMSGMTQQGTRELLNKVREVLQSLPPPKPLEEKIPVYSMPEDEGAFEITKDENGFLHVTGKRIERAAKMTYWDIAESAARFQRILNALGITKALEKEGVQPGDTVFIGDYELEWGE
jgi:GTP-binding protein